MPRWKIKEKAEVAGKADYSCHPIILNLLFQRGLDTKEKIDAFFSPEYERDLLDPFLFADMPKAMERIRQAKEKKEAIVIYGDYDADGVTSSAILQEAFDEIGIKTSVYIPDKKSEGYGINVDAIKKFSKQKVSLIVTVDCGISNKKEVELANSKNIDVIILDHHHIPAEVPPALAIINPNLKNSGYSFNQLAGVGVAFKFVQALYATFIPEKKEQLKWMLDLVAIGTIADCMELLGENRAIVKYGLVVLSKTKRVGLKEMFAVGRISIDENNFPDARKVAFQIAPRINAAGRMDHANTAFNLLREKKQDLARGLALELEKNNQDRQKETAQITGEVKILAGNMFKDRKFIFAVGEHFPIGIVGLVAGKIADEFNKPTAVLQKGDKVSKGSMRSIPQVNIIEAIEKCSQFLLKFGGHSQAAGISVENENLEKFYEALSQIIEKELDGKDLSLELEIEAEITSKDIDNKFVNDLKKFEPFGEGNAEPVFLMKNLEISELKIVGNGSKHLKLFLRAGDGTPKIFEAIGFGLVEKFPEIKKGDKIDAVFNLSEDEWNGNKKIQMKLIDLKISENPL
jgi:single-stranded-DNA-specific exonuclease